MTKLGSSCYLFVDGVNMTLQASTGFMSTTLASTLRVGYNQDGGGLLANGWISELRISKGIARWTSDFTPSTVLYNGAVTNINILGLDGDTDEEYLLICRFNNGYAGANQFQLRFNNDSGNNYGKQYLDGLGANLYAARYTGHNYLQLGYTDAASKLAYSLTTICAKSGYIRPTFLKALSSITGTTVGETQLWGQVWNNTANNITSLSIIATQVNGIGVGTQILLFAKRG
jgi:AraC-like DNA-binding protein